MTILGNRWQFDLKGIAEQLAAPKVRARIAADHGIESPDADAAEFCGQLFDLLAQPVSERPIDEPPTNAEVFQAAVETIASNLRPWATWRRKRDALWKLLGPDPAACARRASAALEAKLGWMLPRRTAPRDAAAILAWARLLAETPDWAVTLAAAEEELAEAARREGFAPIDDDDLAPLVALHLAAEPDRAPGMDFVLACEFLRKLRFDGFKPDRHVVRLLTRWAPQVVDAAEPRAAELVDLTGASGDDLDAAAVALAGAALTPPGFPKAAVDTMVWALGVYVETEGAESEATYLVPRETAEFGDCPFCRDLFVPLCESPAATAFLDRHPVTPGHTLVIPKRHVERLWDLPYIELLEVYELVDEVREILDQRYEPDGYTIGVNDGIAAGQTVPHAHVHVIPRRAGDVADPRGGIRWVIPERAAYWEES